MNIKPMLLFVLAGLNKLNDEERIRYEGAIVFNEIRQELQSAIAIADSLTAAPAPIVQHVITPEQLEDLVSGLTMRISDRVGQAETVIAARIGSAETHIAEVVVEQSTDSDAAVLAAVVETRGEVLAALHPAA